jgi:tripartite-type tricarboxylate transporter receptor subunit TctC
MLKLMCVNGSWAKIFLVCGILLFGVATTSHAAGYPDKSILLVYPFAAGSGGDISTRALADVVSKILGQSVKVTNVAGGRGTIGAADVAHARKDGYKLGSLPTGPAVTQTVFTPNLTYTTNDFEPICQFTYFPIVIVAGPDKPYKTVKQLIEYAKNNPGKVVFAHPGQGSIPYMMMKALESEAGIKMKGIPFKGLAPGVAAAVGGHVDIALAIYAGAVSFKDAGKLNILGLFAEKRMEIAPEIPTVREDGIKIYPQNWCGIFAPKGLDPAILSTIKEAFAEAVNSPEFESAMEKIKLPIEYLDSEKFAQKISHDIKYFGTYKAETEK